MWTLDINVQAHAELRATFRVYMRLVQRRVEALLTEGAAVPHRKTARTCSKLPLESKTDRTTDLIWGSISLLREESLSMRSLHWHSVGRGARLARRPYCRAGRDHREADRAGRGAAGARDEARGAGTSVLAPPRNRRRAMVPAPRRRARRCRQAARRVRRTGSRSTTGVAGRQGQQAHGAATEAVSRLQCSRGDGAPTSGIRVASYRAHRRGVRTCARLRVRGSHGGDASRRRADGWFGPSVARWSPR